jgi:simple sugar transport system ATP-binding protein
VNKELARPGATVLEVSGLVVHDDRGHRAVDGVDLQVRAGEVLGVAGVQGNGQTELVEAVMGLRPAAAGTMVLQGRPLTGRRTKDILRSGVGYIPEDRSVDGLVKDFSVAENLVLDVYDRPPFGSGLTLRPDAIARSAQERVAEFDVRTSSPLAPVATLSGGNQQKVIVARELSRPLKVLIAAQPTRGLDVGSIEFIHAQVIQARDNGAGVLLVSSELDEVLALADRVAVMYRGRVLATLDPNTPREQIGLLMAGITDADAATDAATDTDAATAADPGPGRHWASAETTEDGHE